MAVSKITLPNNTTQDIHDARIAGIDSAPTASSDNLVTSGGVYQALQGKENVIEAITFNGTPATITNKTAAIVATIPNITISSSEPTSSQGSDGDIWIVI